MADLSFLSTIGDKFSELMTRLIQLLSNLGLNLTTTQGKVLNLIVVLATAFIILKVMEKPIKWVLIILLVILALSIGLSFVG